MDELVGPGRVEGPVVLPAPVDLPVGQPVEGVDLGGVLEQRLEELDAPGKILNIIEDVVMGTCYFFGAEAARRRLRCLLYTSPSPRDQRGSRMPSSA